MSTTIIPPTTSSGGSEAIEQAGAQSSDGTAKAPMTSTVGVAQTDEEKATDQAALDAALAAEKDEAPEEPPAKEGDEAAAKEGERTDDEIKASLKEAGGIYADPRYEAAALEFEKTGEVTDATRDAAAAAFGVPRNAVDDFIAGQVALREASKTTAEAARNTVVQDAYKAVGGEDQYKAVITWAAENIPQADQDAYNRTLDTDPQAAALLMAGFNAQFKAAGNGAPRDLTTEAARKANETTAAQPFASMAEQKAAFADPRYDKDAAFRAEVQARVSVTKL